MRVLRVIPPTKFQIHNLKLKQPKIHWWFTANPLWSLIIIEGRSNKGP